MSALTFCLCLPFKCKVNLALADVQYHLGLVVLVTVQDNHPSVIGISLTTLVFSNHSAKFPLRQLIYSLGIQAVVIVLMISLRPRCHPSPSQPLGMPLNWITAQLDPLTLDFSFQTCWLQCAKMKHSYSLALVNMESIVSGIIDCPVHLCLCMGHAWMTEHTHL